MIQHQGLWIVEVRGEDGEWNALSGDYSDIPAPVDGGTEEQVIAAERESAARQSVEYDDGKIRALWVAEE